jgi:enoyl-CoA hydratase
MTDAPVLFARRGVAGVVTLNRPAALNAVTLDMVRLLRDQLERWRHDDAVTRVIVTAAGERAFSAGGDLRWLYECICAGRHEDALTFWREEYGLNAAIKRYPKPYVALIDGIVMGGGVGVSVHGSHRVAGDKFLFAMPEVGIGFFPDVGATWFLPRLPGERGVFCALTGERVKAADGVPAGIATHRVASTRFPELADALCGAASVDALLAAFAEHSALSRSPQMDGGSSPLAPHRAAIDRLFAADSVENILDGLDRCAASGDGDAAWAGATAAAMRTKAPLSLKLTLAQMRRGRAWSFAECMTAEFRMVSRVVYSQDFQEGIRAVIIDKDNHPRWRPATLAEIAAPDLERYFAPLADELDLS